MKTMATTPKKKFQELGSFLTFGALSTCKAIIISVKDSFICSAPQMVIANHVNLT